MEAARSLGIGPAKSRKSSCRRPQDHDPVADQPATTPRDLPYMATGFAELLYQAQQITLPISVSPALLIVAVIYFVAITLLTQLANFADRKINK